MNVYTGGTFDLLHRNHLYLLEYCRSIAGPDGKVIVGVNTDSELITRGKDPIVPFEERIYLVRSLKTVDMAVPQNSQDYSTICNNLCIDAIVVGDDWQGKFDYLNKEGIDVYYTPRGLNVSSSSRKIEIYEKLLATRAEL